jgi:outer membrane protein assembly factor BamB
VNRRRWTLLAGVAAAVTATLLAAYLELRPKHAPTIVGSTTKEYVTAPTRSSHRPPGTRPRPARQPEPGIEWSTYGYDQARTRAVTLRGLRPPFRRLWTFHGQTLLEFPPVVGYGRVYIATFDGRLLALDARTGKTLWRFRSQRCGWSSPALADHLVVVTFIGNGECHSTRRDGVVAAFDARTGVERWERQIGPTESSPLVAGGVVYVGDWDGVVWALAERSGRTRWTEQLDGAIKGSLALGSRRLYIGTYGGELACLALATGRILWRSGGHGAFYSSPAVAYGRVYIGSLDDGVYAFGATTGDLLWSRPTGGYVYASPAVWDRRILIGSYDHSFYALDAGTGEVVWRFTAGAPVSGAATVVDGLVYFSSFDERTYALDAQRGSLMRSWRDGKYSPVVAVKDRLYLVGLGRMYALAPLR